MRTTKVVTVGDSGSGKTVYFTVLHHILHTMARSPMHHGLMLESDRKLNLMLSRNFETLNDKSTQAISFGTQIAQLGDFWLELCGRVPGGTPQPFGRFNYIEYAGSLMRDGEQDGPAEVKSEISARFDRYLDDAGALLAFLDGGVALAYASSRISDSEFNSMMLPIFLRIEAWRNRGPIHFVITKWDLCASGPGDYTVLEQLHEKLLKNRRFVQVLSQRGSWKGERSLVRLIPISALGWDFIGEDRKSKKPNGTLQPFNIEVPLFYAVHDLFDFAARRAGRLARNMEKAAKGQRTEMIEGASDIAIALARETTGGHVLRLTEIVIKGLSSYFVEAPVGGLRSMTSPRYRQGKRAFAQAVADQLQVLSKFEERLGNDFPCSVLAAE